MKKISIKREQSQAGLSFAEREKFRPQVKIKLLLLLVLLAAVVSGAWAQTETLLTTITATGTEQASYSTANVATVSFSYLPNCNSVYSDNWGWWGYGFTATVTAAEGYTITKCVFYDNDGASATDSTDPFIVETEEQNKKPKVNGATFGAYTSAGIKKIEVYGYVTPAATGYSITLDEGTGNKDSQNWEITPKSSELAGGEDVTVKYNGSREVKSVTVVKKAAPAPDPVALSAVTADNIGGVVTSDGNVYPAKTAVPAGKTAVGILGKVTATGHGLILALQDAAQQNWNTINGWPSVNNYAGTTLKRLPNSAYGNNLTSYTTLGATAVSNWAVAQKSDYDAIFTNLGSKTGDSDGTTYDSNVNAYITTGVGGTAISGEYWSATMVDDNLAWYFSGSWWNHQGFKEDSRGVRPVLGF